MSTARIHEILYDMCHIVEVRSAYASAILIFTLTVFESALLMNSLLIHPFHFIMGPNVDCAVGGSRGKHPLI